MPKRKRHPHAERLALHIRSATGMAPERLVSCNQALISCLQGMSQRPTLQLLLNATRLETYGDFSEWELRQSLLVLLSVHALELDEELRPYLGRNEVSTRHRTRRRRGPTAG